MDVLDLEVHRELVPAGWNLEGANLLAYNRRRCSPFNRNLTHLSHLAVHFNADFHLLITQVELFSGLVVDVGDDRFPLAREVAHSGANLELLGLL